MNSLQDKTAVVTGGGSGIGQAIAKQLGEKGARVIVVGRRSQPLTETVDAIQSQGGSASAVTCDLTDATAVEQLGIQLLKEHVCIDILINNAGFSSKVRSARYVGAEEWRAVMDVNTLGPAMLTRALMPPMIEQGSGDVVMISSMAAIKPSVMAGAVYSSAKAAVRAYMQVLGQEVRQHGIRCITVFPGEVDTAILDNRPLPPAADLRAQMMQPEDIATAVLMTISLPRRAMVSELAMDGSNPRDLHADTVAAMTKQHE